MSRDDLGYNLKLFSEYLIQKINHRILIQRITIQQEKNKNYTYYILQNNLFKNTLLSYKRFILFLHCLFRHVSTWLRSLELINEKELPSFNKFHGYQFSRIVIQSYIEVAIIDHIFVNCDKFFFMLDRKWCNI